MRLSLKTKFTLATSLLVLAVVAVVSGLYIARLTRQTLRQADDRAHFVAHQVFLACQNALADAAERGDAPASEQPRGPARLRARDARQQQHPELGDGIGHRLLADHLRNHHQRSAMASCWFPATPRCAARKCREASARSTSWSARGFFEQIRTL